MRHRGMLTARMDLDRPIRTFRRLVVLASFATLAAAALAPVAQAERALGVVSPDTLVSFDTATPGSLLMRQITGLGATETVLGIDKRPLDGAVLISTVPRGSVATATIRTYVLNPDTGAATLVGTVPGSLPIAGDRPTGYDFQPIVDRIRFVQSNNENGRINPTNGTLAGDDTNLTFPSGGGQVIAIAYDRNVVPPSGMGQTTLYAIGRSGSQLMTIGGVNGATPGGPNGGVTAPVGPLGITLDGTTGGGFDISGATGIAYAALDDASAGPGLYTVNLTTGAATLVARLPSAAQLEGLTILDPIVPPPDVTAPRGLLGPAPEATARKLQRRTWKLRFSCNEACSASSTLVARVNRRTTTLGRGSASLAQAGVASIGASLTSAGRKLVRRLQSTRGKQVVRATLIVVLADAAGNSVRLKAPVRVTG